MKFHSAIIALGALALPLTLAACNPQNRWGDRDKDGDADTADRVGTTTYDDATTSEERARAAETFGLDREDNAPATVDAQISQFQSDIKSDPELAAAAENVNISKGDDDNVYLRGTVATNEMKDALEDYCEALVEDTEIDCHNEVTVTGEVDLLP